MPPEQKRKDNTMENWKKELYPVYHRAMWQWLHDNPCAAKEDWPGWEYSTEHMLGNCFACEYAKLMRREDKTHESVYMCHYCPCLDTLKKCDHNSTPFPMWSVARKLPNIEMRVEYRKKYAAIIRDSWK